MRPGLHKLSPPHLLKSGQTSRDVLQGIFFTVTDAPIVIP